MNTDVVLTMVFAALVLAPLTAGLLRVVWVVLFDEYIGFLKPSPPAPPSRFEVSRGESKSVISHAE